MKATATTFADLEIGTVVSYNDMANVDLEMVILDSYEDGFGRWVNVLHKENNHKESKPSNTQIDNRRWKVVA